MINQQTYNVENASSRVLKDKYILKARKQYWHISDFSMAIRRSVKNFSVWISYIATQNTQKAFQHLTCSLRKSYPMEIKLNPVIAVLRKIARQIVRAIQENSNKTKQNT